MTWCLAEIRTYHPSYDQRMRYVLQLCLVPPKNGDICHSFWPSYSIDVIYISFYLPCCLSFQLTFYLSFHLSFCLFFCLSFLSIFLSFQLYFYLSIFLSNYLTVCLSIHQYICLLAATPPRGLQGHLRRGGVEFDNPISYFRF